MENIWRYYYVDLCVRSVKPLRSWREINTRSPKFMIFVWKKYSINFSRNVRKEYRNGRKGNSEDNLDVLKIDLCVRSVKPLRSWRETDSLERE